MVFVVFSNQLKYNNWFAFKNADSSWSDRWIKARPWRSVQPQGNFRALIQFIIEGLMCAQLCAGHSGHNAVSKTER